MKNEYVLYNIAIANVDGQEKCHGSIVYIGLYSYKL